MERIKGGRRERVLEAVEPMEIISADGLEGDVARVKVEVASKSRARELQLAEKRFRPKTSTTPFPLWKEPARQVAYMEELRALERETGLGLRLPPTYRLRDSFDGQPIPKRWLTKLWRKLTGSNEGLTILMTELDAIPSDKLVEPGRTEFREDSERQMVAAGRHGYVISIDAFIPVKDEKAGKTIAILTDLGQCTKK